MQSLKVESSGSKRLSTILATAFFSLSAVVLLLYGGMKTYHEVNTQQALISSMQQLIAQDAAKTVSGFINENFSTMETASRLTNLSEVSEAEQRQILQSILGMRHSLRRVVLLNMHNQVLARASRLSLEAPSRLQDQFERIEPGKEPQAKRAVGPVYFDPVTSEPMVSIAVPVTDVFEDRKGTLIAELNLKSMWDIVEQLKVGKEGYVYVSDREGNLLAFYDTARVLKGEKVSGLKAVADFIQDQASAQPDTAVGYRGIMGSSVVGTYAPLKSPDWAVVTELPLEEAYREIAGNVATTIGITFAMACFAGIFGTFVAKRLSVPVSNLTATASRIAAGERDLQASVGGPQEVALLAMAFNSMTAQLRQSLQDIELRFTDLKRTEEALRISEERLRLALEGTYDGIWDWNTESGQAYFSPRCYTMLGYEPNEFASSFENWLQLIHPDDLEATVKAVQHAVEERTFFIIEFRIREKGNEWRWILSRGKAAESEAGGKAVRVTGSHTDITERKRAEEALRKYERIVSTSQDLMALVNRNYVYEAVNSSYLAAHQRARVDVVGRTVPEVMGESVFLEKIRDRIDQALAGRAAHFQETFDFARLGRRVMDVNYFPIIDENGNAGGVVVNARDITATRKLEEQLIQSQKMESIGTLAGGVAHEINNPINGIMNYAQLILDTVEMDSQAREYAQEIHKETQRIARIVRNLLTFARHEKQSHSPARLADVVSAVLSLIQTVIRHDQIVMELAIPEDLPMIKCRSQQIQQVLMNLMTNARDALNERYPGFSPEKRLRIAAEVIIKKGRPFIRTTVEDTGTGIPAGTLERIFDPFFTTKPKETGTGLGLSISYGIVKDHGGELSVESEPNALTRFHIDLPVDNGWTLNARDQTHQNPG